MTVTTHVRPAARLSRVTDGLKLNIGCGGTRMEGWVNCDFYPSPYADVTFDAMKPWPFPDGSAQVVYASHVLEHLVDHEGFFTAAWHALRDGGGLLIRVPYGGHRAAWWDPTHVRPWFAESFAWLQPGYDESSRNPQHAAWPAPFCIGVVDQRLDDRLGPYLRTRLRRRLVLPWIQWIPQAVQELWVHLAALKSEAAIAEYRATHEPHTVGSRYVMYRHALEARPLRVGEYPELVPIGETLASAGFPSAPQEPA